MADERTEKQKVKEITDKLEEGLKELFESEKYKSYLSTMSKFHNYSFNNTLLIAMQKPEATLVAGYKAWQKNFERHVNKGEKAIRILAPAPYKIKEERDKIDPVTGEMTFDENGMPQKEEVEVTIPAFRAVSVFDVSQTDGKPIPELEALELLSTVEGYEDFVNALMFVSPVPIGFEDIPGDSKGYFHTEEKRIAIQENMSESQTLKTMVHEVAHSMLHNKEVNQDILAPAKDRNTKEVEAESVAYTVCQHFGIDTSDYSFGYIAGWSSGKDMTELKSSLDTIRHTASELIIGIETQLQELQLNQEMEQSQSKESLLLIQNDVLTEFSLINVRGMDRQELIEVLSVMNEDDKLSIPAYLESKGAWTTELGNEQSEEVQEYHLDVRYNTDTDEIKDMKAEMELDKRAKEPIGADDVILKITHADGFEVERITNKTSEEVQGIMAVLTKLEDKNIKNIHDYVADDNLSVSAVYRIPKEEFESVIMKYFNIDSETLQSKTVYDSEDSTYEYKPRGFEEVEYPEYPYSEVIGYTENSDGTITLTANVVFPYSGNSKVYAHEVVVRPLEDGGVQYVSNRIIPSEDNSEETWHTPRLTLEEWEELYGGE